MGQAHRTLAGLGLALTLAALGTAAGAGRASAETAAAESSGYTVVARCTDGDFSAVVADWSGHGPALYVYRGGRRLTAQWASERLVENDERVTVVGYGTARGPLDGGADLRIRARDELLPDTAGTAHLLYMDGGARNVLMECSVY
jgi:hypothetical protein